MAQRGRPKGGDSAETRLRIIDAARKEFASSGFGGASIATIAAAADLAPSAVYHYFGGKATLYEDVFEATVEAIWTDVDAAATKLESLQASVESIVVSTDSLAHDRPFYSDFLALVPMETKLHPEFQHLIARRAAHQNTTFRALAELGLQTGELQGFDLTGATEMLRALIMGWFLETYFRGEEIPGAGASLITLVRLLGER